MYLYLFRRVECTSVVTHHDGPRLRMANLINANVIDANVTKKSFLIANWEKKSILINYDFLVVFTRLISLPFDSSNITSIFIWKQLDTLLNYV